MHIDHIHDIAFAIAAPGKRLDAAGLAKEMVDGFGVEPIGRQIVRARNQREIGLRHGLHDPAQPPAPRTVAIAETREVGMGAEADGAAMALALMIGLVSHFGLLY